MLLLALLGCPPASDDTAPTDDTSVTDDTGTPPATCVESHATLRADLGGGAALAVQVEPAFQDLPRGAAVPVEVVVTNVGTVDLSGGWGGCVDAAYTLRDAAGTEVWTEPEESTTCTQPEVDLVVGARRTIAETLDLSAVPAGSYVLVARIALQVNEGRFTSMERWEVGATVHLATGACPTPGVEAWLGPRDLRLRFGAPSLPLDAAVAHPLTAGGAPDVTLTGAFGDCGQPRFAAEDAAGTQLWTASPADVMDCAEITEWPAGEDRAGTEEVPAGTWAAAATGTAAAWYTETTDPTDPLRYRLELGVSTR